MAIWSVNDTTMTRLTTAHHHQLGDGFDCKINERTNVAY